MPWNGAGSFTRLFSWVADKAAAINITASRMDADSNDIISAGLGNAVTRDGQGIPTANLPMANFRHTGVADGVARSDYASLGQLEDGVINWQAAAGTADALSATYTPAITVLKDGQLCFVRATAPNATTTPTFAPNGLAPHTITKQGGAALAANEWVALEELVLRYNLANTRWERANGHFTGGTLNTALVTSASITTTAAINEASATLASAATVNIGAASGNYLLISGTTGISSFGPSVQAGTRRRLTFQGALTLTPGGSLIVPTSGVINVAAGDSLEVEDEGANVWRVTSYQLATGKSLIVPSFAGVRQTVLSGATDSNGAASFITTTAGLTANLLATTSAVTIAFALGFGATGPVDAIGQFSADQASFWSGIPASNLSFLSVDRNSVSGALTASQTLAPPQYGQAYDRTRQSVLQFGGAAGSTTFLDDFGNAWTPQGSAKVQTNSFKFGTGGLGGAGTLNALNGTTDYVKTTDIKTLGSGGWSMRGWINPSALPAASNIATLMGAVSASNVGAQLGIFNNAGTIKFALVLSSNGTTNDIANAVQGTTTPVVGTWYFIEMTFDAIAGQYRLYVNGVQENSVVSTARVAGFSGIGVGAGANGAAGTFLNGYIDKPELLPYCQHPSGTAYAVPTGAPSITAAGYASDWFSTAAMQMNTVAGGAASGASGTNPTFATVQRVYVGEATAGAATISSTVTYALQGQYVAPWTATLPGVSTLTSKNHNIGTTEITCKMEVQNLTANQGYVPGDIVEEPHLENATYAMNIGYRRDRNAMSVPTSSSGAFALIAAAGGADQSLTAASWQYRFRAKRTF